MCNLHIPSIITSLWFLVCLCYECHVMLIRIVDVIQIQHMVLGRGGNMPGGNMPIQSTSIYDICRLRSSYDSFL